MIYLLEDDESIRRFVLYALNNTGFEAVGFELAAEFWRAVEEQTPELVLLDIMLPDEDGLSVLRRLRGQESTARIPVIMLTARSTEYDKVVGLDSGADDYVTKPFGTMELVSRIRALLRRSRLAEETGIYRCGALQLDTAAHQVRVEGQEVVLTYKEYELLRLFCSRPGRAFNRDELLQRIWGYDYDGENRTVDVHIKTLRTKLGAVGSLIETVRGVGYRLHAEP